MRWHALGHAMWLAEVEGLRLLFDPLLEDAHHGGVFDVFPGRVVEAERLRPDFVLVSHAHPDHFDVASLARLARLDPETVVITPDALVAEIARRVGFSTVRQVPPGQHVELDRVRLVTSPSTLDGEWGTFVCDGRALVWNQVDTAFRGPDHVRQIVGAAQEALGRAPVDLVLARWQPLREVEVCLGGPTGFPLGAYRSTLAEIDAIGARAVVPSAAGAVHRDAHAFMNRFVHPVPETRFLRDLSAYCPETVAVPHVVGATYEVWPDGVRCRERGAAELVRVRDPDAADPRVFAPTSVPPVRDPGGDARGRDGLRRIVERWVRDELTPAVPVEHGWRFVLDVVFEGTTDVYCVSAGTLTRDDPEDWDGRVVVAGTPLVRVLEADAHWGDLLLAGQLRARTRAYDIVDGVVRPAPVAPIFLYYALSYEEAFRRSVLRTASEVAPPPRGPPRT